MEHLARLASCCAFLLGVQIGCAHPRGPVGEPASAVQVHQIWIDPATKLVWAATDNGKDVRWSGAVRYCRDLRLAGYSDWRLPTLPELKGIFDLSARAPVELAPAMEGPSSGE